MEKYQIVWTSRAKKDLRKVFDFYALNAGHHKASSIVQSILERIDILADSRFIASGAIDEDFVHLKHSYKKLIEGNIKITYRISARKPIVYINRLFDTRQHPPKE